MFYPTFLVNRVFIEQVDKFLREIFHQSTMFYIRDVMKKRNICVIALVMFYENRTTNPTEVFRLSSCLIYSVIENYVWNEYLCCQSKTFNVVFCDKVFENTSYNESLGIFIPEVLMDLIPCHWFTKNTNSTVILVLYRQLVNYYLEKGFVIIEHNSKHLSSVPKEANQIIHAINIQKYILLWRATQNKSSVANTIDKLYIKSNLNPGYKHNFYYDKQEKIDDIFDQYHLTFIKSYW